MPSIKDRRARFTKQLIKETYLTILKDKPANKITVADICTRGDLNRSTFYLHYHDIVHVLEEIEDDVYREWTNIIVNMSTADDIQTFCYESYLKLFEKESFRFVFMNSQPGGVYERIVKTSTECFSYAYSQAAEIPLEEAQVLAHFIVGGYLYFWRDFVQKKTVFSKRQNDLAKEIMDKMTIKTVDESLVFKIFLETLARTHQVE